jgi:hypothetical protein
MIIKSIPASLGGYLMVTAYDAAGNALITNDSTEKSYLVLFGDTQNSGASADRTTLKINSPALDTLYTRTFDLRAWTIGRLNAGKSWSDVDHVVVRFQAEARNAATNISEWWMDNFR